MFILNELVTLRYNTLINNIKNESNSYYDAYLDLLESTIKTIMDENNIPYDPTKTCGQYVRSDKLKDFLINEVKLNEEYYNKLPDYIKKCNDHKHKKEKKLSVESVINYVRIYFELLNGYLRYKLQDEVSYDELYFINIFGQTKKIHQQLIEEKASLTEELEKANIRVKLSEENLENYKSIVEISTLEHLSLEDENVKLSKEISLLKDFKFSLLSEKMEYIANQNDEILKSVSNKSKQVNEKSDQKVTLYLLNARKDYIYFDLTQKNSLKKEKKKTVVLNLILIGLIILETVLLTINLKIYSTYTMFQNIWLIFLLIFLSNICKLKHETRDSILANHSHYKYSLNKDRIWIKGREKLNYKVFRLLAIVLSFCNIICCFDKETTTSLFLSIVNVILELGISALIIVLQVMINSLYGSFDFAIKYTGQIENENRIIYLNLIDQEYYSEEEFLKKYGVYLDNSI